MNLIKNIELKQKVYGGIDGAVHLLVAQQAARLEAEYDDTRLDSLVKSGGLESK